MKVKDFKKIVEGMGDEVEVYFYINDYEYDEDEPQELGVGKFVSLSGRCINIGINK